METGDIFHIKSMRVVDTSFLSEFLKEEYPDGNIADKDYLTWEYVENPSGRAYISYALNESSEMASQYALIPIDIVMDGDIINATLSLNTLTARKFRGKGLFVRTAEANFDFCREHDVSFTVGIPNANSFPGFVKKLGFIYCGNLSFYVKPLRPGNILKSVLRKGKEKKGMEINFVMNEKFQAAQNISYFDFDADESAYEKFWIEWKRSSRILVNRSLSYLSWRYSQNPLRKYHILKICGNGRMNGIAIFRTMTVYGMRVCVLMDFFSTEMNSGTTLLNAVAGEMKRNGLDIIIAATAAKNGVDACLKKVWFLRVPDFMLPQQLPFIVRAHKHFDKSDLMTNLDNWHFTFGDYDIF